MRHRESALIAAIAIVVAACGGAKAPETAPNPSRALRDLSSAEADVTAIALEAVRALPPTSTSPAPLFAGVFVGSRRMRQASDAVARRTGFTTTTSGRTGTVTVECRATNMSTGQSTPVPCPASARSAIAASLPPVFSFEEVTATADSAYVGILETTNRSEKGSCVTLTRTSTGWRMLSTTVIADARRCGK